MVSRPLLSLSSYYRQLEAARLIHSQGLPGLSCVAKAFAAEYQACLPQVLQASTHSAACAINADGQQSTSLLHQRHFASQSSSRLQQTVNRAKRAAQAQQGSRAVARHDDDPASNTAVDSIPQEETSVQASQSRPTTLQVRFDSIVLGVSSVSFTTQGCCR